MKPEIKDPKISELQQKLEAKRAERIREQENSRLTADAKSANRLRQMAKDKVRWKIDNPKMCFNFKFRIGPKFK